MLINNTTYMEVANPNKLLLCKNYGGSHAKNCKCFGFRFCDCFVFFVEGGVEIVDGNKGCMKTVN